MKVAIVHDFLVRMGGAEHVLSVFKELFPEADIYTAFADLKAVKHKYSHLGLIRVNKWAQFKYNLFKKLPIVGKKATKLFYRSFPKIIESFDFSEYDLVIANSSSWCHGVVTDVDTKVLIYIHSPMRFAWDYTHAYKRSLGAKKEQGWWSIWLTKSMHKARLWDALASKRGGLLLCNSRTVQRRIEKFYRKTTSHIVYPPVDVEQIPGPRVKGKGKDYLLIVSTLTPYKNILPIVEWATKKEIPLIIAGSGPQKKELERKAGPTVSFVGYVTEEQKWKYLAEARALMYPSMEDFGIGPVEAQAAGVPVLAFGKGGALETVEHMKTGIHFKDHSMEALDNAMLDLAAFEKHMDPEHLRMHSTQFSRASFKQEIRTKLKTELGIILKDRPLIA